MGYDLNGVIVGSEGTLAVVTDATVQLQPKPEGVRTLVVVFPTIEDGSEAVSAIIAAGIVPAALEMMDGKVCRAVEEAVTASYPRTQAACSSSKSKASTLKPRRRHTADRRRLHRAQSVVHSSSCKRGGTPAFGWGARVRWAQWAASPPTTSSKTGWCRATS
ncbi:MAG: FAD-linked oxidase C-terminal domain-containing protein [Caldilineaceae bacterium]